MQPIQPLMADSCEISYDVILAREEEQQGDLPYGDESGSVSDVLSRPSITDVVSVEA